MRRRKAKHSVSDHLQRMVNKPRSHCKPCPDGKWSLPGSIACSMPANCTYMNFETGKNIPGNPQQVKLNDRCAYYQLNLDHGQKVYQAKTVHCSQVFEKLNHKILSAKGDNYDHILPLCTVPVAQHGSACRTTYTTARGTYGNRYKSTKHCRDGAISVKSRYSFVKYGDRPVDASTIKDLAPNRIWRNVMGPCITELLAHGPRYSHWGQNFATYTVRCAVFTQSERVGQSEKFAQIKMIRCVGQRQFRAPTKAYKRNWNDCQGFAISACTNM